MRALFSFGFIRPACPVIGMYKGTPRRPWRVYRMTNDKTGTGGRAGVVLYRFVGLLSLGGFRRGGLVFGEVY